MHLAGINAWQTIKLTLNGTSSSRAVRHVVQHFHATWLAAATGDAGYNPATRAIVDDFNPATEVSLVCTLAEPWSGCSKVLNARALGDSDNRVKGRPQRSFKKARPAEHIQALPAILAPDAGNDLAALGVVAADWWWCAT